MNFETFETVRFVAALGLTGLIAIVGLAGLLLVGLSHDPDAWLERQAQYWRTAREKGQ